MKKYYIYSQILILALTATAAFAKSFNHKHDFEISTSHSVTKGYQNSNCPQFQAYGYPVSKDENIVKRSYFTCRLGYAGQFDPSEKTPLWSAEHITAENTQGQASRDDLDFIPDPEIPTNLSAFDKDYSRSGYQKGHMAPAADFKYNQLAMNETFFYSNAVPQAPQHNMHIWNYLEAATRELANRRGELYVITGPIYSSNPHLKLKNNVSIPDAIFKVLVDPKTKSMTAFIIPNNDNVGEDYNPYQVTVREVEKVSGLNFNPSLSRSESDKLEVSGGDWIMPKPRKRNKN